MPSFCCTEQQEYCTTPRFSCLAIKPLLYRIHLDFCAKNDYENCTLLYGQHRNACPNLCQIPTLTVQTDTVHCTEFLKICANNKCLDFRAYPLLYGLEFMVLYNHINYCTTSWKLCWKFALGIVPTLYNRFSLSLLPEKWSLSLLFSSSINS